MRLQYLTHKPSHRGRMEITYQVLRRKRRGFLWLEPYTYAKVYTVVGSSTVWHFLPDHKRCPTYLEGWLSEQWNKIRYEEEKHL